MQFAYKIAAVVKADAKLIEHTKTIDDQSSRLCQSRLKPISGDG
jgi:hypothetical protein